jgi:hypothetical protein
MKTKFVPTSSPAHLKNGRYLFVKEYLSNYKEVLQSMRIIALAISRVAQ